MAERYVTLLGAEQVQQAANKMQRAATDMQQAASMLDETLRTHHQFMEDWLARFGQAIKGK